MKVKYDGREYEFEGRLRGRDIIRKLGLNTEAVLVIVEGKLVSLEDYIDSDKEVEIIKVISGG